MRWGRNGRQAVWVIVACFVTLGLPTPRKLPLGNENCYNVTYDTKLTTCSEADDVFPFSQYCMWFWTWNQNFNDEEIVFNCRPTKNGRVSENVFGIWINRFRLFVNRANLIPDKVLVVVMATLALQNLLMLI